MNKGRKEFRMTDINLAGDNYSGNGDASLLTPEKEGILSGFLTKQMLRLIVLLIKGTLTNKELAVRMGLSSSALSNILQRMKKCEIELLVVSREEKNVLYSLTPIVREYVEKNLPGIQIPDKIQTSEKIRLVRINQMETVEWRRCKEALEELRELAGPEGTAELLEYCTFYYTGSQDKVPDAARDFFEALEELIIEEQTQQTEWILNRLEEMGLKALCQKYLKRLVGVRKLCTLDTVNWEAAARFTDDFFLSEDRYVSIDFLKSCYDFSTEDIIDMAMGLSEIIKASVGRIISKKDFIAAWSRYFKNHDKLVFYIGEKYVNQYHRNTL